MKVDRRKIDKENCDAIQEQEEKLKKTAMGIGKGTEEEKGFYHFSFNLTRLFTEPDKEVFSMKEWAGFSVKIVNPVNGETVYEGNDLEFPIEWSDTARRITAGKYFKKSRHYKETSLKQLISRIADTIARQGDKRGYFIDETEREAFRDELKYIMLDQRACFNSPVLFNIGVPGERPQASACFINSVKDDMADISRLIATEGMIFKWGSGSGVNFSTLRSEGEPLSTGGTASGPLSFMKVLDSNAGAIKSGGKNRRAAKMCVLNVDHPDIEKFIDCKVLEEKKARILTAAGYDGSIGGEAYSTVSFQNANNSVRVTDQFMQAVEQDKKWLLLEVVSGNTVKELSARKILRKMAEAAWITGDPGIQFDTATNDWHTCPESGRINSSNPCSEFVFLDDSACNLASINLLKYLDSDGSFRVEEFAHTVRLMILAQDILCDFAEYPSEAITRTSLDFRPLGLGYTNLGALLMVLGFSYDSENGRALASAITALMHGFANETSGWIAERLGPFKYYELNRKPITNVMEKHRAALAILKIGKASLLTEEIIRQAKASWDRICSGQLYRKGFRNSQVTLLAPTGTISFFMDAVTTGVEPELSLVKHKNMVDGNMIKLVNPLVRRSMENMGLETDTISAAEDYILEHGSLDGFNMPDEYKKVFATSLGVPGKPTTLPPEAHLKMLAAVQPFLSGAISKTVNLPHDATVEDIEKLYLEAWKLGLKSLAVYRDGSKMSQPLVVKVKEKADTPAEVATVPKRKRLPATRKALTHKFEIAGHEGYVTAGCYDDGTPGEIFILMHKEGSILSGLLDAFGIVTSIALQYGAPLEVLVDKMTHMRFEPSGLTKNRQIPMAKSIVDYIFRWLSAEFLDPEKQKAIGINNIKTPEEVIEELSKPKKQVSEFQSGESAADVENVKFDIIADAPTCPVCGTLMQRRGSCYTCPSCGETSGCS